MPPTATKHRQLQFGPFTVDPISRELHGSEGKIRLQGLPFQILTILTEQPGEWITRDELRQKLWPADTFVDFDHSINTAIGKLRRALGDDADEPRYIETRPRLGYRLILEVEEERPQETPEAEKQQKKNLWKIVVPSFCLLLAAVGAVWLFYPGRQVRALTDNDTIVLADIDNKTGDEVFDEALKQALAVELDQSPFLNVLPDDKVRTTLGTMGRATQERITADMGREVCVRAGSKALLIGSISRMGSHYVIGVNALACSSGMTLAKEQGEAASKEEVLKTVSRISSSLRKQLGESLPSVQMFNVPVEATTPSLEALNYFSIAQNIWRKEGHVAAMPFFKRAIEIDPNFASAYSDLAVCYDNMGQSSRALEYSTKAYRLRERTTKREQLRIAAYYLDAIGDLNQENEIYELWAESYPRDGAPHSGLASTYETLGQFDKSLAKAKQALSLDPRNTNTYTVLGQTYLFLNRLDEAQAVYDLALSRNLDDGLLRQSMYYLAFLRGDATHMEEQVAWAAGKPGNEDLLLGMQSDTEAFYGRMKKARETTRRTADSAIHADATEMAAFWQAEAALREAEMGNATYARQDVAKALALSKGRDVKVHAALVLARTGDITQAKSLIEELQKSYPANTLLKVHWLPSINAAIEINRGNAPRAISLLEDAASYELAGGLPLYPTYLRGQAYLLEHDGTTAAAEFQKLVDHKSVVQNFVTGSLAHLQLGRAYALAGDKAKAKAAYQDFFSLLKDADPDVPVLKEAHAEYSRL